MANYPSDLPCMHDEFVELLWDNGPVMQGPSSRPRKSSVFTASNPSGIRVSDKDTKDNPFPKIGHFKVSSESKANNFATCGPSSSFGINAHYDDMVPWINYPMEDPIDNDYCSEFLSDYSGVDLSSVRSQTSVVPAVRTGFSDQVGRDSHNTQQGHASASSRIRESRPLQLPTQLNSSTPCSKSSETDLGMGTLAISLDLLLLLGQITKVMPSRNFAIKRHLLPVATQWSRL
ncbi:uncharacterized protein A4U43_C02F22680 [Asparagus officinalis]|uniref:Uncharacterized protein n=1 Tax=Asparagus officinalis TaxID=4686 RepID=A0A5P1FL03_ASPOF|nr:uncharacterized protein LOC109831948 [Asparagus officinalis]XP_020255025.1 uncharacterized protein LOC109831948 [Asparagus officinalis]ONK78812.1 uncharacterized protein A4U43_C02F22680 [Asparagus officinalis]